MSWLPVSSALGDLEIHETFVDLDGPRVFSCLSRTGQLYLVGWAQELEEGDLWLYMPVSESRFTAVRSGGITLRTAFENPEHVVYEVLLPHDEATSQDEVRAHDGPLPDEWLPEADFKIELPTRTLQAALDGGAWRILTLQERRVRLRLMVKWPGVTRTEAPTRKVGEVLISTQSLIDNIGLATLRSDPPQAGRIPLDVADQTATDVVGLSAASFVIDIASNNYDDLFDGSVFLDIVTTILGLLDPQEDQESLIDRLVALRPRGAKSFRNFVRELVSTGGDVTIAGAGTRLPYIARDWPADRLAGLGAVLENIVPEDTFEIRGRMRLYRADTDRKQFGVIDELTNERYEGRISERAAAQVDHAVVNEFYDALVSEFRTFDQAVGESRPTFVLEQLTEVGDSTPIPAVRTRIAESVIESESE